MQPIILTSDKTMWSLRPQAYLLQKYWPSAAFVIGGYTAPDFTLPTGYEFRSIGAFEDYPVNRWSDGAIKFLESIDDDIVLFMMDDYWLFRAVDNLGIWQMTEYMQEHEDVARFDVCTDRLFAKDAKPHARYGHLDIIKSDPWSYAHFSFQASLWRRKMLIELLRPDESPWDAEIRGDARLREAGWLVLGTRQAPMMYTIAVQKGKFAPDGGYQTPTAAMNQDDLVYIVEQGWIPEDV